MGVTFVGARPWLAAIACLLALAGGARAESLPPLTDEQARAVAEGRAPGAFGDEAFEALLEHTRSWGSLMRVWGATPAQRPEPVGPTTLDALVADADGAAGREVAFIGRVIERGPLPRYANAQRWVVEPVDPDDAGAPSGRVAVVYVAAEASALPAVKEPDWFVFFAGRFYKRLEVPGPDGGTVACPAIVGSIYHAGPSVGGAPSSSITWFFLGVAAVVAAVVSAGMALLLRRFGPRAAPAGGPGEGATP